MSATKIAVLKEYPACPSLGDQCRVLGYKPSLMVCSLCQAVGPYCGRAIEPKALEEFKGFAKGFSNLKEPKIGVSPAHEGWRKTKVSWLNATRFIAAVKSRGYTAALADVMGITHGAGRRVDEATYQQRHISCFGDNEHAQCSELVRTDAGAYCGACGCGKNPLARLDETTDGYSKLHYPVLECPLARAGFSNYDPERAKYAGIYADPKKYPRYGHSNHGEAALKAVETMHGRSLLDVGCGHNEFVRLLREKIPGINAVGLDFECPSADVNAEATAIPFPDKAFEIITAFDVLEHIREQDIPRVLAEMARVATEFIFTISYSPSVITWKGQNLHPTVKPEAWWLTALEQAGAVNLVKRGRFIFGRWGGGLTIERIAKVVLVGNGPSLLGRGLGATIDAFDEVVRFNRYQTVGFEKDVGRRTSLWSTFGRGVLPEGERANWPGGIIVIHANGLPPYVASRVGRIPMDFYEKLRARVQSVSRREKKEMIIPSSGLLVCCWLLDALRVRKLVLAGIDHFSKTASQQHHYWNPQAFRPPSEHDGEAEGLICNVLVDAGKIEYL